MLPSSAEAILVLYLLGLSTGNPPPAAHPSAKPGQTKAQAAPLTPGQYAERSASSTRFEIEAARLAAERATHGDVRAYARSIVASHNAAADPSQASVPRIAILPSAGISHEAWMKKLGDLRSDAFDLAYLQMQIAANRSSLDLHRRYAKHGEAEALRAVARASAVQLERRLAEAETLLARLTSRPAQSAETTGDPPPTVEGRREADGDGAAR